MAYDITELKKLSTEEKLQIIDELWQTIEGDGANEEETLYAEPEVAALLQERIEKYESGEGVSYKWEEAKKILLSNIEKRRDDK